MESGIPLQCASLTGPSCRVEGWVIRRGLLEKAVLLAVMGHRDAGGEMADFQAGSGFQNSLEVYL